jgi:hypothetical protein
VQHYDISVNGGMYALEEFVKDNMYEAHNYSALIVTGQGKGDVGDEYGHAVTFIRLANGTVGLLDYEYREIKHYPRPLDAGLTFKFVEEFINYTLFQVYEIAREPVTEDEATRINNEMHFVMTGKLDYLNERRSDGGRLKKKRKSLGFDRNKKKDISSV